MAGLFYCIAIWLQHLDKASLCLLVPINVALGCIEALVTRQVLHIANAATTIRNLAGCIGDERPPAAM